jgi:hypothetical protein
MAAKLLAAHRPFPETCSSRSVSGACGIERCSPRPVPFPPQPPQKVSLPCSAGSQVLRHSPTSPARACPPFGLWPSRTGLDCQTKACWRSPGFSCMLFLSVRGFSDYAGPTVHSRLAWLPCCLPPTRNEVGILIYGLFAAQSPRPPMPLSTLQETPRDVPSKTRGQDGFATSFPVGLLHPLQHAGLSRRSPGCPSSAHNRYLVGEIRAGRYRDGRRSAPSLRSREYPACA